MYVTKVLQVRYENCCSIFEFLGYHELAQTIYFRYFPSYFGFDNFETIDWSGNEL